MPDSSERAGSGGEVTSLLAALAAGDESARPRIIELLYGELRRLAAEVLREKRRHGILQRTDLIGEAFLRLRVQEKVPANTGQYLSIAAEVMRRVVLDHARALSTRKRGGGRKQQDLDEQHADRREDPATVIAMNELVEHIERQDKFTAAVIVYRFYAGYSEREIAAVLRVDEERVRSRWRAARGFLSGRLRRART